MGSLGEHIGFELGKLEQRYYASKTARTVALVGRIIGRVVLVVGVVGAIILYSKDLLIGNMNERLFRSFMLVCLVGVIIESIMAGIAALIEKRHSKKTMKE